MVLVIGVALIVALIVRQGTNRDELRSLALIGAVALGLRLVAIAVVYVIATRVHAEGTWLNDEASYFLATEALMPWPWDKSLPGGLDHLGGNGYLGLTSAISLLQGSVNSTAFRLANGVLGSVVALVCALVAQVLFGRTAAIAAGLAGAVWPDLILWSATFVRDMLASVAVISVWWALVTATKERKLLVACSAFLALVLLSTLREYLAVAVAVGVLAWLAYPRIRRQRRSTVLAVGSGLVVVGMAVALIEAQHVDEISHDIFYRQVVTRMETLGRLYRDPPPLDQPMQLPFRPGAIVGIPDTRTGWLLTGVVTDSSQTGYVSVDLSDDSSRTVPISEIELLQDARIPPLQLFSWVVPSMGSVLLGLPEAGDDLNVAWIASALAWDALLALAVYGVLRGRLNARQWVYPLFVTLGTIVALAAIPGAPGNAERHRATQTVPLLLVLASGVLASRSRSSAREGRTAITATSRPVSATTAVASVRRSDRFSS